MPFYHILFSVENTVVCFQALWFTKSFHNWLSSLQFSTQIPPPESVTLHQCPQVPTHPPPAHLFSRHTFSSNYCNLGSIPIETLALMFLIYSDPVPYTSNVFDVPDLCSYVTLNHLFSPHPNFLLPWHSYSYSLRLRLYIPLISSLPLLFYIP